jgi:hypothetical protein
MPRRHDGRRCRPTSAAYGAIAVGWGTPAGQVFRKLEPWVGEVPARLIRVYLESGYRAPY